MLSISLSMFLRGLLFLRDNVSENSAKNKKFFLISRDIYILPSVVKSVHRIELKTLLIVIDRQF